MLSEAFFEKDRLLDRPGWGPLQRELVLGFQVLGSVRFL